MEPIHVRISDPDHPHYPESGVLAGQMISVLGKTMALVKLDSCRHGTDACYVSKGQVTELRKPTGSRIHTDVQYGGVQPNKGDEDA